MANNIEKIINYLKSDSFNNYEYIVCLSNRFYTFLKMIAKDSISESRYNKIISLNEYETSKLYEQDCRVMYINDIYAELPIHYKKTDDVCIYYACPREDNNQYDVAASDYPLYDVKSSELLYGETLTELDSQFDKANKYNYLASLFESRISYTLNIKNKINFTTVINNIKNANDDKDVYNAVIEFLKYFKNNTTKNEYEKFEYVIYNLLNDFINMISKDLNAIKCAYIYDYRIIINKCGSHESVLEYLADEINYLKDNSQLDVEKNIPIAYLDWYLKNNRKNKAH